MTVRSSSSSSSHSVVEIPSSVTYQGIRMPPSHLQPKSAREWNSQDLDTLFVEPYELTVEEFFGCHPQDLPKPQFTYPYLDEILEAGCGYFDDGPSPQDFTVKNFFKMIETVCRSATEANVDQLAYTIMTHLGYQLVSPNIHMDLQQQLQLYFEMDGVKKSARIDVAMINRIQALLCLYVKDKKPAVSQLSTAVLHWPHPQVVAHALGAFNANMNDTRRAAQSEARLAGNRTLHDFLKHDHFDMVIPVFTLTGTLPCFYIIPITAPFASAVARGEFPPHPTQIFYCVAPVQHAIVGMMMKSQRYLILQMFEAFKRFIPTNFAELCRFDSRLNGTVPRPFDSTFTANVWDYVREFLWESDEHCRRKGIDKSHHTSSSINYSVDSCVVGNTPNNQPSSPQPRIPLPGYPSTLHIQLPMPVT